MLSCRLTWERLADAVGAHLAGAEVALLSYDSAKPCKMSREGLIQLPFARQLALPIDIWQPLSGAAFHNHPPSMRTDGRTWIAAQGGG